MVYEPALIRLLASTPQAQQLLAHLHCCRCITVVKAMPALSQCPGQSCPAAGPAPARRISSTGKHASFSAAFHAFCTCSKHTKIIAALSQHPGQSCATVWPARPLAWEGMQAPQQQLLAHCFAIPVAGYHHHGPSVFLPPRDMLHDHGIPRRGASSLNHLWV